MQPAEADLRDSFRSPAGRLPATWQAVSQALRLRKGALQIRVIRVFGVDYKMEPTKYW